MEPDVPIARHLDPELVNAATSSPNVDRRGATASPHRQCDIDVQEDALPAARVPETVFPSCSGGIMEGHFAWAPYEKKSQDLIRKECSLREIKLNTRTNKADRIRCYRRYDELMNSGQSASAASTMAAGGTRRTKHCTFRLANVVLSDNLFMRLIEATGRSFDRTDLDDAQSSAKSQFGRDVAAAYHSNDEVFRGLIEDDPAFEDIDPGVIVPHNQAKLEELWKELTSFFSVCAANFRLLGTHDHEFKQFVHGKMDVLYLWYWLEKRPEALNSARGRGRRTNSIHFHRQLRHVSVEMQPKQTQFNEKEAAREPFKQTNSQREDQS
ncbi:hypothetical protein GN244_ATG04221 [Phytophthora infestans]|uniref:Uncharacterized protein n=1 Tax=Phytophthora infestans TaxID=4787 RepID=A0A833TBY1_PHYIN|nr:hypothetical protein GN244_ATG04221 [Phytophthora infestans]KAF4147162.1 hypothetical protein GN958_ATG03572 [Phytophthora infestans]